MNAVTGGGAANSTVKPMPGVIAVTREAITPDDAPSCKVTITVEPAVIPAKPVIDCVNDPVQAIFPLKPESIVVLQLI